MPLFFKKRSDIEVAPYSDEERDAVMAALQLMFEENENLKYKDIGSIVCVVDSEGLEKKYTLRCRIFRNPQGQLVAVAPEILGAGAFGMVYLGQNLESAQFCVAKQQKQDISSEIDNFNGIYADEYKSQTFVVKPKLNVPLWIGFMPFFNGVDGDSVGYACSIPERQLGDLVFFEPHEEAANNKKRMQIIDDHTTEPAPKKKPVRSDSENTMVVTPLSEEEGELLGDFPEGNHPIITKTMEFIANNKHVDFDSLDFKAFFQDIFDGVGATTKNKTKAFGAFKRHFAKLVASAKISDHAWGDNVDSLPNNFKISTLAENLQSSVEVALSFVERVQTAHDQNYLLKDLKAENIIVAPNHKVYLIDSDAVIKMLPGVTTIQSTAMARSGTPQYFSPEATAEVKYNQLHYEARFLQALRSDPDLAGTPAIDEELAYAHSVPVQIVYDKKADIYALGESLHEMLLKITGIPVKDASKPEVFDNPNSEPAIELLNRVLAVIARLKDDSRPVDASLVGEFMELEDILILIKSLNQFDRDKGILPRLFGKVFGSTETEHEKMWRAAASLLVAELNGTQQAPGTTYNYKHVVIPGVAEIKRKRNEVFVQLPKLIAADLEADSKIDPVLAMLENLNPGSQVVIGNCAQTPQVALILFEKAVALGLQPKYATKDGTEAAIQRFIDDLSRQRARSI